MPRTTIGWSTPRARIDSASSARPAASKSLRGWRGLGSIRSTGIWRRPFSRPPGGSMASSPRPMPRRGSGTCGDLAGELEVGGGTGAGGGVAGDGEAEAGGFADANVARDGGLEDTLREVLTYLPLYVAREACPAVVHREDEPGDH